MAITILHLACAKCGAVVNKIEYDVEQAARRVESAAAALGVDISALTQHTPDPAREAHALAASLANPTDSPCPTPGCPGGEVEVK